MKSRCIALIALVGLAGIGSSASATYRINRKPLANLKKARRTPGRIIPIGGNRSAVFMQSTFFTARRGDGFFIETNPATERVRITGVESNGTPTFQLRTNNKTGDLRYVSPHLVLTKKGGRVSFKDAVGAGSLEDDGKINHPDADYARGMLFEMLDNMHTLKLTTKNETGLYKITNPN
jgi:hypothetical protein